MKSSHTIPLAIVFGGIVVALAIYVSVPKSPAVVTDVASIVRPVDSTDHIFGNPAAKVVIVEYADFDCEYCKYFNDTMHQIIANEGAKGQVAWVFREFPLSEIHPNALSHARAAECAAQIADNDTFWKFETALFDNQPVDRGSYGMLAQRAGVSGNAFATCYAAAATTVEPRILKDRQNALDMGAQGTPFSLILIAGKPPVVLSDGFYSYEEMRQYVDQALSN